MEAIEGFFNEYSFLSNFYEKKFIYKGKTYLSSEHAYQAYKATNEEDHEYVRLSATAYESKKRGRKITIRPDFDKIKNDLMFDILIEKFKDTELRQQLLDTGDAYLEETNMWHDNYWGICNCENCESYMGKNNLGKTLMNVRKKYEKIS